MNKILEKQLAEVFEQDYQGYEYFVENVINKVFTDDDTFEVLPVPENILDDTNRKAADNAGILQILKIGSIDAIEGIDVYDITLRDNKHLQYNRVGIQQLIRSQQIFYSNAFLLFHNEHPEGKEWRFSFFYKQGKNKDTTSAKRFTYLFGKNYRARTASERFARLAEREKDTDNLLDAFSVETLSKDFFNEYKSQYLDFCKFLFEHKADTEYFGREFVTWEDKYLRDYVKKMMGRITFIYFLQRKGWMNGDYEYMQNAFKNSTRQDNYLDEFLEPLFFGVLNTKPKERKALFEEKRWDLSLLDEWKDVPYLNGGLFERDKQDEQKSKFPAELFKSLFDFYSRYNFTIDENDPEDAEVGVDPEMLGHIFENLLEDNKDKGAFYTPKEIVQYMSKECVAQYLKNHAPEELHTAIDSLIKQRVVEPILQNKENARLVNKALSVVKVCDPAIGSGAFPMGVLNVLFDCRHLLYGFIGKNEDFSYAKVKRDIIQNNIYGVDIEKGAVDIARLRFWLALVVDENEPQPLPNLDYKIMCGDSLLHRFTLDAPFQNVLKDYNQKNGTHYKLEDYRQWVYDYTDISDHTQKDDFRKRIEDIKRAVKTELSDKEKGKIVKVRGAIDNLLMGDFFGDKKKENEKKIKALQKKLKALEQHRAEIESNKIYDHAFEWRFEFPALLDEKGDFMGFDIVIGNPPYVLINKDLYREVYGKLYNFQQGKIDLYRLFIEEAVYLSNSNGIISYITPNTFLSITNCTELRKFLLTGNSFLFIDNYDKSVFDASVNSIVFLLAKGYFSEKISINIHTINGVESSQLEVCQILESPHYEISINADAVAFQIKHKMLSCSTLLNFVDGIEMCLGAQPYHNTIHSKEEMKTKFLHSDYQVNENYVRDYGGKHFSKYIVDKKPEKWIDFSAEFYTKPDIKFFEGPRIVVREIPSSTLICAYIEDFALFNKSVFNIRCSVPSISLKYLLAILNSKAVGYYITSFGDKSKQTLFPRVSMKMLKQIPIPQCHNKHNIINIIDSIIERKKKGEETMELEQQIDLLVYHLYRLTYDEVLIIDPETPIKREEYEL